MIYLHQYLRNGACYNQSLYEVHIVSLLVDPMTFDLGWPLMSNQGNWVINGPYLLNVSCYDKSWYETQSYSKSYMVFRLISWPLTTFKGQIKYNGLYLLNGACYDQCLHITQIVSHIYGLSFDLMILDLGWHLALDDLWHLTTKSRYLSA